jgi:hypothetical protein
VAGFPRLELAGFILLPCEPKLGHDARVLRRQPIDQLIQVLDGGQHSSRDFDGLGIHAYRIADLAAMTRRRKA